MLSASPSDPQASRRRCGPSGSCGARCAPLSSPGADARQSAGTGRPPCVDARHASRTVGWHPSHFMTCHAPLVDTLFALVTHRSLAVALVAHRWLAVTPGAPAGGGGAGLRPPGGDARGGETRAAGHLLRIRRLPPTARVARVTVGHQFRASCTSVGRQFRASCTSVGRQLRASCTCVERQFGASWVFVERRPGPQLAADMAAGRPIAERLEALDLPTLGQVCPTAPEAAFPCSRAMVWYSQTIAYTAVMMSDHYIVFSVRTLYGGWYGLCARITVGVLIAGWWAGAGGRGPAAAGAGGRRGLTRRSRVGFCTTIWTAASIHTYIHVLSD